MEKLFSYGTLQQENVQIETFGRKLFGYEDTLTGFELGEIRISDPGVIEKSGKTIHPILRKSGDPDAEVQGTVFEITEAELCKADAYEVDDYTRVMGNFKSGTKAWVYIEHQPQTNIADTHG